MRATETHTEIYNTVLDLPPIQTQIVMQKQTKYHLAVFQGPVASPQFPGRRRDRLLQLSCSSWLWVAHRVAQSYPPIWQLTFPPTWQLTFPPTWQLLTYLKVMEDLHHHLLDHLPTHLPDSDGAAYVWAGRSRREDTVKKAAPHIVLLFSPQHGILCILLASPDHWSSWSVSINYCVILRAHSLWPPKSPHGFHSLIWNKPENPDEDARVSYSVNESSKTHKQKNSADGILPLYYVSSLSLTGCQTPICLELGNIPATKSDEFSEQFQTAFLENDIDFFRKVYIQN